MHILPLTRANREKAIRGIDAAIARGPQGGAWTMELRPPKRTDAQNAALWSLLGQIQKQRPTHNGVRMTTELWKCVFLNALGMEARHIPTLDGDGLFPIGQRSSHLSKAQFAALLELILAWTAREGLAIEHFDHAEAA